MSKSPINTNRSGQPHDGPVVRLALVDDQTIFRELLQEVLVAQARGRYVIVGHYSSGRPALEQMALLSPDVVILDIVLPDMNGLDVLRELKRYRVPPKVLVVTACEQPPVIRDALTAGAHGIVTKGAPLSELQTAVDRVSRGGSFFCASSSDLLRRGAVTKPGKDRLTSRERLVLQRVATGASSKEIASELQISEKTVHNHRHNIKKKLGIHDIAGLIRFAVARGLIEPGR